MVKSWYAFRAYNSQTIYAYGTQKESERYEVQLNSKKAINLYAVYSLTSEEAKQLDLENRSDTFNLEDVE